MFSFFETKEDIAKAQHKLETTIRHDFKKKAVKNIGYPGGTTYDANIYTKGINWIWSSDADDRNENNSRRLNWIGLFQNDFGLRISVEINTPYEGRNDNIARFFAIDNNPLSILCILAGLVVVQKELARHPF